MPRILIADANPERREAIARALPGAPEVVHAVQGRQALTELSHGAFAAAVLALQLPLLSGEEVARSVGAAGIGTPLVLVGAEGPQLQAALRLDNVLATVPLPLDPLALRRAVTACLVRPAAPALASQARRPSVIDTGPVERPARILVVDDDPIVRDALQDVLSLSYEVWTAGDGLEALRLTRTRRFDAVLVDLHMPVIDGEWTARRLRDASSRTSVLLMSADDAVDRIARRVGATAVRKPFEWATLHGALTRAVAGR